MGILRGKCPDRKKWPPLLSTDITLLFTSSDSLQQGGNGVRDRREGALLLMISVLFLGADGSNAQLRD